MVWPQTEAIAIDKRDVVPQRKCTGTVGESDGIRDGDQLRIAKRITALCPQEIAYGRFSGESVALGRMLRLNHGHGVVPATMP